MANPDHCLCFYTTCLWNESGWVCEGGNEEKWYRIYDSGQTEWFSGFAFFSSLLVIHQDPFLSPCRCLSPRFCFMALPWHPLTTISLTLIRKTDMHGDMHDTKPQNRLFASHGDILHARTHATSAAINLSDTRCTQLSATSKQLFILFTQSSSGAGD